MAKLNDLAPMCRNCTHWRISSDVMKGECHRFPPSPFPLPGQRSFATVSLFPMTLGEMPACGEYRRKAIGGEAAPSGPASPLPALAEGAAA